MEVTTRQGAAYGVARLALGRNEPVHVESVAMMAVLSGAMPKSKLDGGIMKSLKRAALGGESPFVTTRDAQMQMRKAGGAGLVQSFNSGEGYVFDFGGPGKVCTHTRNPTELMGWIQSFVGTGNSPGTSIGGAFGGLLGRD